MLDTKLMAMVTAHAHDAGAKLILVGDDRQLSSIDRGGMFGALKDRHGAAELSEVKRQHKIDERRAAEMMAEGNFHDALGIYEQKGRDPLDAHPGRGPRRAGRAMGEGQRRSARTKPASCSPTPMTTWTSSTPPCAPCARQRGELGEDHELDDRARPPRFRRRRPHPVHRDRQEAPASTTAPPAPSRAIDGTQLDRDARRPQAARASTSTRRASTIPPRLCRHDLRARATRSIKPTSITPNIGDRRASYVALTRHREKAELFVARNTAQDVKQLARQMARTDDRRAASMFEIKRALQQEAAEAPRRLAPAELLAVLAPKGDAGDLEQAQRRDSTREQPAGQLRDWLAQPCRNGRAAGRVPRRAPGQALRRHGGIAPGGRIERARRPHRRAGNCAGVRGRRQAGDRAAGREFRP